MHHSRLRDKNGAESIANVVSITKARPFKYTENLFYYQKMAIFLIKNSDIFFIFLLKT